MKIEKISELRNEYLTDEDGSVLSRSDSDTYKSLDADQLKRLRLHNVVRQKILEGYAAKYGEILDPIWSQYSYEEILQMEENGVLVPKEVSEMAHALQDNDATYYEIAMNEAEQEQALEDENSIQKEDNTATKKASFFELVGKATAKITQSEEKQDQIGNAIKELTPTANELDDKKHKFAKLQKDALERLKEIVDEWKTLKDKAENGKELTASEQKRYEELSKVFDEENQNNKASQNSASNELKEITKSLREIDTLAQKGEQIGSETKDAGFELTDFVCKDNYKATRKTISQDVGMIGAMIAMAKGKRISSEAITVGTETQVFSNDTQISLNEIATVLEISKPLSIAEPQNTEEQTQNNNEEQGVTAEEVEDTTTDNNQKIESQKSSEEVQDRRLGTLTSNVQAAIAVSTDGTASGADGNVSSTPGETENTNAKNNGAKSDKKEKEQPEINKGNAKEAAKEGQKSVDNAKEETKDGHKETKNIIKDETKTEKELEKEAKALEKKIKKQAKQMLQIDKETAKIEKKQEEMIARYEEINQENDELIEEAKAEQNKPQKQTQNNPQPGVQNAQGGQVGATASFGVQSSNQFQGSLNEKIEKIEANNKNITTIGAQFDINNRKVDKNRTTVNKLSKNIKTTNKKFQKTTKLKDKKANERVKSEQEKQAKLQKKIAIVGMLESVFSLTTSIGTVLLLMPWTSALGSVLVNVGLKGTLACGLTKAAIYAANGDIKAAFITLGTTIMTATTAAMGAGGATGSALSIATASLSTINSAAKVGASIREVQGKDAGMLLSSISAISGIGAAVTGGIQTLGNLGNAGSNLAKASQIASVSGSMLGSTSEMISTGRKWAGKDGDTALTKILNYIGMGLSTAGALGQLGSKISDKRQAKKAEKAEGKANNEEKAQTQENEKQENTTELADVKTKQENNIETPSETKKADNKTPKQTPAETKKTAVDNQTEVNNTELADLKNQQQTQGSGTIDKKAAANQKAVELKGTHAELIGSNQANTGRNVSDGGTHAELVGYEQASTTKTSTAGTMPNGTDKTANNTSELKPKNPEALTGELQGPSDAPIKEAAKGADINKLTADAKQDMNTKFSNEPKRPKLKFEDVAKGIGSALSMASQFMPQETEPTEETKAKNPNYVMKSQKNMQYFRKIQRQNEAQRLAFGDISAQNGGTGNKKKRR